MMSSFKLLALILACHVTYLQSAPPPETPPPRLGRAYDLEPNRHLTNDQGIISTYGSIRGSPSACFKVNMGPSGSFYSHWYPEAYGVSAMCGQVFEVSEGKTVQLTFQLFDVEGPSPDCLHDRVKIYDGPNVGYPLLGTYCGGTAPGPVRSTGRYLLLVLETDNSISARGFNGTYREVTAVTGQCGKRPYDTEDSFFMLRNRHSSSGMDQAAWPKIVGGHDAVHGEYPWQARVHRQFGPNYSRHWCGAVIINNHWLLSAAHCYRNKNSNKLLKKSDFEIIVGDHDKAKTDDGEQTFAIEKLILHKGYAVWLNNDDIALIKIRPNNGRVIEFNHYVQPACLPSSATTHPTGESCLISGWGDTKNDTNGPSIMQGAEVPVWSQERCNRTLGRHITGGYDDGMMCAGFSQGGVDTCQGDSGGPLVCQVQGSYTLFGLTSFGFGCGKPYSPGVYARVAHFLPWIKQTMADNSKTDVEAVLPMS